MIKSEDDPNTKKARRITLYTKDYEKYKKLRKKLFYKEISVSKWFNGKIDEELGTKLN